MQQRRETKDWPYLIALIGVAIAVCVPFIFAHGIYNQDDFLFHKARLLAYYAAVVHDHDLLPHVLTHMAGDFGYPADIFYSSLPLLPFVALKALFGGFVVPYHLYLGLLTIITALCAYGCAKQLTTRKQAFVVAAVYTANTYRLIAVFVRGALGEVWALAVLPLLALGVYATLTARPRWRMLATGMSLMFICHPLSAAISVVLIAVLDAWRLVRRQLTCLQLRAQLLAAVWTLLLTAFLTVPMIEQAAAQQLVVATTRHMWAVGLNYSFATLVMNSLGNNSGVWAALGPNIGPLALGVLAWALVTRANLRPALRDVAVGSAALFVLSSNLLLWAAVKDSPLAMIQFEWRLLAFVALGTAVLTIPLRRQGLFLAVGAVLLAVSFNYSATAAFQNQAQPLVITDRNAATTAPEAIGGGYEFLPTTVSPTIATDDRGQTLADAAKTKQVAHAQRPTIQGQTEGYTVVQTKKRAGLCVLPKLYYPGYQVKAGAKRYRVHNAQGLLAVKVGKVAPSHLTLRYVGTTAQKLSALASGIAGIVLIGSWWRWRRA